jgi:hypothetical protein
MTLPTDPWDRIGLAESMIREIVECSSKRPPDMTTNQLWRLEATLDHLEEVLGIKV